MDFRACNKPEMPPPSAYPSDPKHILATPGHAGMLMLALYPLE